MFQNVIKELPEYSEKSKNIDLEKKILRENTRLPEDFIEEIEKRMNKKPGSYESLENSDLVQLMKEVY